MSVQCQCGKEISTTAAYIHAYSQYDKKGNLIYAVCPHGQVIVDRRVELVKEKLDKKKVKGKNYEW